MAKGNDGSAARRRTMKKLLVAACCSMVIVGAIISFGGSGAKPSSTITRSMTDPHRDARYDRPPQRGDEAERHGGRAAPGEDDESNREFRQKQLERHREHKRNHEKKNPHHAHHPPHRFEDRGGRMQQQQQPQHHHHHHQERRHHHRANAGGAIETDDEASHGGGFEQRVVRKIPKWQHPRGGPAAGGGGRWGGNDDAIAYADARERRMALNRRFSGEGGGGFHHHNDDHHRGRSEPDESDSNDSRDENEHEHEIEHENEREIERESIDPELAAKYRADLLDGWGFGRKDDVEAKLDGILNGSIHLVGIEKNSHLKPSADGSYGGVVGRFCKLDFSLHKKDPSKYPMFRFLLQASPGCEPGHDVSLDLRKVTYLAKQRDLEAEETDEESGPKVLELTAVAFHESRCGSTLVANSMIAMDPEKHRVYSESSPPVNAFHICGDYFDRCTQAQAAAILRDTIYMMSRTDDVREERVFFKFQSITSKAIPTFQMAFPEVPWMYVYRDPVQVMMSHVKDDPLLKRAICTKTRRSPPREVHAIAKRHGRSGADDLEPSEYCAAHLAQLTEAAVKNLNDMAIPVPYDRLPAMMWESIMPKILGRPLESFEIENLERISKSYSKQGKGNKQGEFTGDSEQKEKKASDAVRKAAEEFLKESFDQLAAFESKVLE